MFGLGPTELVIILVVALLVLGPNRLPELASGMGRIIRDFRKATRDLSDQVEVDDSIRKPIMELKAALRDEPPPLWTQSVDPPRAAPVPIAKPEDCLAPPAPGPQEAPAVEGGAPSPTEVAKG